MSINMGCFESHSGLFRERPTGSHQLLGLATGTGKQFLTAYLTFKRAFNTLAFNALQTYFTTHHMLNNRSEDLWLPGYPAWRE